MLCDSVRDIGAHQPGVGRRKQRLDRDVRIIDDQHVAWRSSCRPRWLRAQRTPCDRRGRRRELERQQCLLVRAPQIEVLRCGLDFPAVGNFEMHVARGFAGDRPHRNFNGARFRIRETPAPFRRNRAPWAERSPGAAPVRRRRDPRSRRSTGRVSVISVPPTFRRTLPRATAGFSAMPIISGSRTVYIAPFLGIAANKDTSRAARFGIFSVMGCSLGLFATSTVRAILGSG